MKREQVNAMARIAETMQRRPEVAMSILIGYASDVPTGSFEAMADIMSVWDKTSPELERARFEIRRLGELLIEAAK